MRRIYSIGFTAFAFVLGLGSMAAQAGELLWYGQAAVRITTDQGKVIVIDPFITKNPKTPDALKDLAGVGQVDLILITHGHGDHVGDLKALAEMTGAKVGVNADFGHTLRVLGVVPGEQLVRFNKSGPIQPIGEGITVTMVHAEHSSDYVHKTDAGEAVHPGGEPVGYIIELENGYKIYHAGDTGVFSDMALIKTLYDPDLSLLPIGGHFTMDPAHAAFAVKNLLKSKAVLPIHYGTFPPLKGTPEAFKKALGDYPVTVFNTQPGEAIRF